MKISRYVYISRYVVVCVTLYLILEGDCHDGVGGDPKSFEDFLLLVTPRMLLSFCRKFCFSSVLQNKYVTE